MGVDVLGGLRTAIDAVCEADAAVVADAESIVELHRQLERLEAAVTRATASFDAGGTWEADGARTAAAWLATRCRVPLAVAQRRVRLGRDLRHMPAGGGGVAGGRHRYGPGDAAGHGPNARRRRSASTVTRPIWSRPPVGSATASSCGCCRTGGSGPTPTGWRISPQAQHQARRLHLSESFDGAWFLDGVLDPISGAIVDGALNEIEKDLFESDWAEAKARVGDGVCGSDLARTPAQRRADALVEMARRAMAVAAGGPTAGAVVHRARRLRDLRRADLRAGQRRPWSAPARWCRGSTRRGPSGSCSTPPTASRTWACAGACSTGATRRAVEVRDRECFHELCEITADDCEIDHVEPWATGGLTVDDNGRVACGFHNRLGQNRGPPE